MDSFKLYDLNLVDQATITCSSENALFPVSNLKDPRRSKVYRSINPESTVLLDFQETSEVDGIFIIANKRSGFGISTVTVHFNHSADFSAPPLSVTVPLSEKHGVGHITFDKVEYRFAQIELESGLSYCELSKVFIGKSMPLKRGVSLGWSFKDDELSSKQKNRYGQLFTDVIGRQKKINFALRMVSKEDLALLTDMLDRVGETKPFYIAIGNNEMIDDYRRVSGPVILDDTPTISNTSFGRYNLSLATSELT